MPNTCSASPFSPILEPYAAVLPLAFREQFLLSPAADYQIVLEGQMDRIWHRPHWLWPFFHVLVWADILFPESGDHIPASLIVSAYENADHQPCQAWRRSFHFPRGITRRFNALTAYDNQLQKVIEWMGPANLLQATWDIDFELPGRIVIQTAALALRLGPWKLPIPRWLGVNVRAIEQAVKDDTIHIDLTVTHPGLGPVFGYAGTFRLRRQTLPVRITYAD